MSETTDRFSNLPVLESYPLNQGQLEVWRECMEQPDEPLHHIACGLRLAPTVNAKRLVSAARAAIDAHPMLKARIFLDVAGRPRWQRNDDAAAVASMEFLTEGGLATWVKAFLRPFNLVGGELYRVSVIKTNHATYLFFDVHEIVFDRESVGLLTSDISAAFMGDEVEAELWTGFDANYREHALRSGESFAAARAFYREEFGGVELGVAEPLTQDLAMPQEVNLPLGVLSQELTERAEKMKTTSEVMAATAFALVLGSFAQRSEAVFALRQAGRAEERAKHTVSLLARYAPAHLAWEQGEALRDLYKRLALQQESCAAHDVLSFEELSALVGASANITFAYYDAPELGDELCGVDAEQISFPRDEEQAWLAVSVCAYGDDLRLRVVHRAASFDEGFAQELAEAYDAVLGSLLATGKVSDTALPKPTAETPVLFVTREPMVLAAGEEEGADFEDADKDVGAEAELVAGQKLEPEEKPAPEPAPKSEPEPEPVPSPQAKQSEGKSARKNSQEKQEPVASASSEEASAPTLFDALELDEPSKDEPVSKLAAESGTVTDSASEPSAVDALLAHNSSAEVDAIGNEGLGDVLLSGVETPLGMHVLRALLDRSAGRVWCLVRSRGSHSAERRLADLLTSAFDDESSELVGERALCVTYRSVRDGALDLPFRTLVDCSSFSDDDGNKPQLSELLALCEKGHKRFVRICPMPAAPDSEPLSENKLATADERVVLERVAAGKLDAKIVRVSGLAPRGRRADAGETMSAGSLVRALRGFMALGAFPVSGMDVEVELTQADLAAEAVLRLAAASSRFTLFHLCNSHRVQMGDLVSYLRARGSKLRVVSDDAFSRLLSEQVKEHPELGVDVAAYAGGQANVPLHCDRFTQQALYRLGWQWPLINESYLSRLANRL